MEIENCRMHGQASQDSLYWGDTHMDIHGPGGKTHEETNDLKTTTVWPDVWKHMSDASKRKEKQKWAIEKPKLDNARRLHVIFFIDPEDQEFERTILKKLVESWQNRCQQECFVDFNLISTGNLWHSWTTQDKTCLYCWDRRIFEDTHARVSEQESWRPHLRKSVNSLSHQTLGHQLIPMPQAMKMPEAKAAVEK